MSPLYLLSFGSDGKESACNATDPGLIPGLGRSAGEGNEKPLQYSCLENSTDRGVWWATVPGVIYIHIYARVLSGIPSAIRY